MPVLEDARHELFCQERVSGRSIIDSYVAAGFKRDTGNATVLNGKPHIQERLAELKTAAAERVEITQAMVLAELGKIGFSDIRKLFTDDGKLKHVTMLDDDAAAAIQSIEVDTVKRRKLKDGEEHDETEIEGTIKVKLWDKRSALVDIGKHIGMFKEGLPEPPQVNINISDTELARLIAFQLTKASKES